MKRGILGSLKIGGSPDEKPDTKDATNQYTHQQPT